MENKGLQDRPEIQENRAKKAKRDEEGLLATKECQGRWASKVFQENRVLWDQWDSPDRQDQKDRVEKQDQEVLMVLLDLLESKACKDLKEILAKLELLAKKERQASKEFKEKTA